jgi:hypothetical protein
MDDPVGFAILAIVAVGLIVVGLRLRVERPRRPEDGAEQAAREAEHDRAKDRAIEQSDRSNIDRRDW